MDLVWSLRFLSFPRSTGTALSMRITMVGSQLSREEGLPRAAPPPAKPQLCSECVRPRVQPCLGHVRPSRQERPMHVPPQAQARSPRFPPPRHSNSGRLKRQPSGGQATHRNRLDYPRPAVTSGKPAHHVWTPRHRTRSSRTGTNTKEEGLSRNVTDDSAHSPP